MFIDTNTKQLRRDGDYFTVTPQGVRDKVKPLCTFCANTECQIIKQINAATANKCAHAPVLSCREFIPWLGFSVTDGLMLNRWNTIRIGKSWASRLRPGDTVAIGNLRTKTIVRKMRVEMVVVTSLAKACKFHGGCNHYSIAKLTPHEDIGTAMMKIIRNAYGTSIALPHKEASVIYLQSI